MKIIILSFLYLLNATAFADDQNSFVDGSKPFVEIQNVHRQAEAWAMCAAAYDATSEVFSESRPATAKQFSDLANGAELAVIISIVWDGLKPDLTPDGFDALWTAAKITGVELPKTRRTVLQAAAENLTEEEADLFYSKLGDTVKVCISNSEAQQKYIDTWRDLAKSGLLELPGNQ
jgi:ABC-type sulfate transport system substrate-binding protein